jgi:hypothetical protein
LREYPDFAREVSKIGNPVDKVSPFATQTPREYYKELSACFDNVLRDVGDGENTLLGLIEKVEEIVSQSLSHEVFDEAFSCLAVWKEWCLKAIDEADDGDDDYYEKGTDVEDLRRETVERVRLAMEYVLKLWGKLHLPAGPLGEKWRHNLRCAKEILSIGDFVQLEDLVTWNIIAMEMEGYMGTKSDEEDDSMDIDDVSTLSGENNASGATSGPRKRARRA